MQRHDAAGEVLPGDVTPAGLLHASGERGLGGPGSDGLGEVDVGLGVAAERPRDPGQGLHQVLGVDGAERRPRGAGELTDHERPARPGDAAELPQGRVQVGPVAPAAGDDHPVDALVGQRERHRVPGHLGYGTGGPGPEHSLGEVARDRGHPAGGELHRRHRRPGRDVEHGLPWPRGQCLPRGTAPGPVEPAGQHCVGDVVAARDTVEHGRALGRLLVQPRPDTLGVRTVSTVSHGGDATRPPRLVPVTAAALTSPAAAARTVPTDRPGAAGELLAWLPAEGALSWVRGGEGLVGWGEAARLEVSGPDRFARARDWWRELVAHADVDDDVGTRGSGLVAFGSFAFRDDETSVLVVPEIVL